jgi:hypothetical protein
MKFTYRLSEDASGWLAECVESEAAGEGKTSAEAVRSLAVSLEERMLRPDAVAPPTSAEPSTIELELAPEVAPLSVEPSGPGG